MEPWTVSLEEARELARRNEETRRTGGIPHEQVIQKMLKDMERDLERMVAEYDGSLERSHELLEALLIAEEEGVPGPTCARIRHELALRLRDLTAA